MIISPLVFTNGMVTPLRIKLLLAALFSLLFVSLQGMAVAHEAQFADTPHDHDGKICTVHLLGDRDDDAIQPIASDTPTPVYSAPLLALTATSAITPPPVRVDQARAPPAS